MYKNYLKSALRNLIKHPSFSIINISGLIIGILAFLLIGLYLENEFNYDKHLKNYDNLYRITADMTWANGITEETALAPPATAGYIKRRLPEIKELVRFGFPGRVVVEYENINFIEENLMYADSSFFNVFDFKLLKGNPETILKNDNKIILSEEKARKYFGNEDPIGKVININSSKGYVVSGIIENIPDNTHFSFEMLASLPKETYRNNDWFGMSTIIYADFNENIDIKKIEEKIREFIIKDFKNYHEIISFRLQPISEIHLHSNKMYEYAETTNPDTLFLLGLIALFILLVACINFINLSTARFAYRFKEVGIRKVSGAQRSSVVQQFLWEAILFVFIAVIHAVVFLEIILPLFSNFMYKNLNLTFSDHFFKIFGLTILIGLVGGLYPAIFYSSIQPLKALKGNFVRSNSKFQLRKVLVIAQFVITSVLLIVSLVIFQQYNYLKTKDLGFNKENIICLNFENLETINKLDVLKNDLLSVPFIENISISNTAPSLLISEDHFRPQDFDEHMPIKAALIDENYLPLLNIKLLKGNNFDKNTSDSNKCIINEAAMHKFGWDMDNVLNKSVTWNIFGDETKGRVIGVVNDFHYESLHRNIEPLILRLAPREDYWQTIMTLKFNESNYNDVIETLENIWPKYEAVYPFEFSLLKNDYNELYEEEKKLGSTILLFTILAISIACLGLIGLSNFMADKRTKEFGVRKTFGATSTNIITSLSNEFVILILIANVIAWPVAYYFSKGFLQNFAYQKTISVTVFVIATVITIAITVLTILYQSYKIAVKNPTESLRYE